MVLQKNSECSINSYMPEKQLLSRDIPRLGTVLALTRRYVDRQARSALAETGRKAAVAGHVTGHPRLCGDVRGSVLLCGRTMSSSCFTRALPGGYR